MNSGRFGKNMAADVSAKKIAETSRIFFAETSLPKRPVPLFHYMKAPTKNDGKTFI